MLECSFLVAKEFLGIKNLRQNHSSQEKLGSDDKGYFSGFSITPKEEFKDDFSRNHFIHRDELLAKDSPSLL